MSNGTVAFEEPLGQIRDALAFIKGTDQQITGRRESVRHWPSKGCAWIVRDEIRDRGIIDSVARDRCDFSMTSSFPLNLSRPTFFQSGDN